MSPLSKQFLDGCGVVVNPIALWPTGKLEFALRGITLRRLQLRLAKGTEEEHQLKVLFACKFANQVQRRGF